jgi:uncharacterized protein DUF4339
MYKIIGADQKEYGPVTADQLRMWIAEGRVNAQTSTRLESDADWKPLFEFPEFADALGAPGSEPPPAPGAGVAAVSVEDILARDYSLDIGSCLTRSWELVKRNFWPVVGVTLLITIIIGGINQLLGLLSRPAINSMILEHQFSPGAIFIVFATSVLGTPVYAVCMGGLYRYYLKMIRGEQPDIGAAFSGFSSSFGQLVLAGLVTGCLTLIGCALCILPGIYLSVSWYFTVPLVVDKQLGFWEAMELSRKAVAKHWFHAFGLILVISLVAAVGVIGCCIGVFVTMPIAFVALMYAYEDIFGRQTH